MNYRWETGLTEQRQRSNAVGGPGVARDLRQGQRQRVSNPDGSHRGVLADGWLVAVDAHGAQASGRLQGYGDYSTHAESCDRRAVHRPAVTQNRARHLDGLSAGNSEVGWPLTQDEFKKLPDGA